LPCGKLDITTLELSQVRYFCQSFAKNPLVIDDIPATLSDILSLIHSDAGINIELKMYNSKCSKTSLQGLYSYCLGIYQQVVLQKVKMVIFSSFNYVLCLIMKAIQVEFPVFHIIPPYEISLSNLEKSLSKEPFDGIVMSAPQALLFGEDLTVLKQRFQLKYFTYDQPENPKSLREQLKFGIDGFIVDDPRRYQWLLSADPSYS
jgi:glycerophosphoryl diester phosphodiesterase